MSRGMTIADFVQQVYYAMYKVRLDVTHDAALPDAFHADTDKFKEVVFEANFVLQELQNLQDWNWLRERIHLGVSERLPDHGIMEFQLPRHTYKVATGFNDAVRLHNRQNKNLFIEVPYTSPRSGTVNNVAMFDEFSRANVQDDRLLAFVVGDILTFSRPFWGNELNRDITTDIIRLLEPLHICDSGCEQPCPRSYENIVFSEITDPYYMIVRTAAKKAEGDPSVSDRVISLNDDSTKALSAMRENDSAKTVPDTYKSVELGYMRVL